MERYEERESIVLTNKGQKLFGMFHRPIGSVKSPAIIICHGLAGHKIGHHRLYVTLSEHLSKIGIASLRLDFRGSGDSEGEFAEMTIDSEVDDVVQGLNWLASNPHVDSNRIGLFGRSFGGAVAVIAAGKFKKAKSIALWAPIFNASQWEEKWELVESGIVDKKERQDLMRINGQLPSMQFFEALFKLNLQRDLNELSHIPLLHVHGEKDPIVNISHADLYAKARRQASGQSKFIRLLYSDHDFTHPDEKRMALDETCLWFKTTL